MALLRGQWLGKTIPIPSNSAADRRWSWRLRGASRPHSIIQLGPIFLIATSVARVAFMIFGYAEEHDPILCRRCVNRALSFG